jgi:hypothetical protein
VLEAANAAKESSSASQASAWEPLERARMPRGELRFKFQGPIQKTMCHNPLFFTISRNGISFHLQQPLNLQIRDENMQAFHSKIASASFQSESIGIHLHLT